MVDLVNHSPRARGRAWLCGYYEVRRDVEVGVALSSIEAPYPTCDHPSTLHPRRYEARSLRASCLKEGMRHRGEVVAVIGDGAMTGGVAFEAIHRTIKLQGSVRQVTYAGRPLYTYAGDPARASTGYIGASEFGGDWDEIAATGHLIK
jgi:hypothetical protein